VFTVSDSAADAIQQIVINSGAPRGTGLRIAPGGDDSSLHLSLAPQPQPGDVVYRSGDAQVFLEEGANEALDGQAIEAAPADDGSGGVQFVVGPGPR
jgi:iron-sulfur cluster assembly protein